MPDREQPTKNIHITNSVNKPLLKALDAIDRISNKGDRMGHTLDINDFMGNSDGVSTYKREIASSTGQGHRKSLAVVSDIKTLKVTFEVDDGLITTTAYTLEDAIKLYNELP